MIHAMPWIPPLDAAAAPEGSRATADAHAATGGRMTNMKWTLAHTRPRSTRCSSGIRCTTGRADPRRAPHEPVLPRDHVQYDCLICSTFFRRLLIDAGEDPDALALDELDELIVDFGRRSPPTRTPSRPSCAPASTSTSTPRSSSC